MNNQMLQPATEERKKFDGFLRVAIKDGYTMKEARHRAWTRVFQSTSDASKIPNIFDCLTEEERLQIITDEPSVGKYFRNPTPKELSIWLKTYPDIRQDSPTTIVTNLKSRMMLINYEPVLAWQFTPPPTNYEIFSAVMKAPVAITYVSSTLLKDDDFYKWLSLALVIANRADRRSIDARTHTWEREIAKNTWGNYWNHILKAM